MLQQLPKALRALMSEQDFIRNTTGLSGASVWVSDDKVLKIAADDTVSRREIQMMQWLQGKLPVPQVFHTLVDNGMSYLLMSRLPGEMSCEECYMTRPGVLIKLLAEGLQKLWQVDITGCPCKFGLDERFFTWGGLGAIVVIVIIVVTLPVVVMVAVVIVFVAAVVVMAVAVVIVRGVAVWGAGAVVAVNTALLHLGAVSGVVVEVSII